MKVKLKRSGGFQSQTGAVDFMAILSVTKAAEKKRLLPPGYHFALVLRTN
ncbi:hypothetical protein EVA_15728 [gut metagenome]|uniref:Uncharacterized protein n=1 Tax=gut metagenome TaxID=749906 RepID=J9G2Y7_9ZZZZ